MNTNDRSFPSASDATNEFEKVREIPPPNNDHGLDGPLEDDRDVDEPSEPHLEMHLTPGGELEQIVHTEIDQRARADIRAAQDRFNDGIDENGQSIEMGEASSDDVRDQHERSFEDRMMEHFHLAHDRSDDHDR